MISTRQLSLDGVFHPPSGAFEAEEELALELESKGLATRWHSPQKAKAEHPNKMFVPTENK